MGSGKVVNTHDLYKTVNHEHLDGLVCWANNGDYPSSGLNLVECESGCWFVEVDHGTDFDNIDGVSKPDIAPFVEPIFFDDEETARNFAYSCIKTIHPELKDRDLNEYYVND